MCFKYSHLSYIFSDPIAKYKALLADINDKETAKKNERIEMEFSWGIGMKDKKLETTAAQPKAKDDEKTHFERILELKKEKKKLRKVEQKKLRKKYRKGADASSDSASNSESDDDDDDDMPDGVDMNDPYFAEEFANGDFEQPKKSRKTTGKKRKRGDDAEAVNSDDERRQAELELLLDDGGDGDAAVDGKAHFSLKKIQDTENESKTKRRKRKVMLKRSKKENEADKALLAEDDFRINTADNRFSAVYSSHLYNIDPTNPNFKSTKGMDAFIAEKLKRRPADGNGGGGGDEITAASTKKARKNVEVSMLVKSIKRKTAAAASKH